MNDSVLAVVVDASALLAVLHDEPGAQEVEPYLDQAGLSTVNLAEVVQRSISRGVPSEGLREDLESLGLTTVAFTADDAVMSAELWRQTRSLGLSLGDRACLALGMRLGLPVLTADRTWAELGLDVDVTLIR